MRATQVAIWTIAFISALVTVVVALLPSGRTSMYAGCGFAYKPLPNRAPPAVLFGLSLLLGLLLMPSPAAAASSGQPSIGEAEIVVRQVQGLLGEITREIALKDSVYSEEVVETGTESATRLALLDGTEIALGPSSRATLDRYVYNPDSRSGQLVLSFVRGVLEFVSGSIDDQNYDLRTPFAHLSVRGTRIVIADAVIAVTEGSVLVRLNDGREVLLSSSQCVVREPDGAWRQLVGASCDAYLDAYRTMLALLAGNLQPGQDSSPSDLLRRLGYVSPERNLNQRASQD